MSLPLQRVPITPRNGLPFGAGEYRPHRPREGPRLHGATTRGTTIDPAVRFRLDYQNTNAHLDWSMTSGDRSFKTNPAGQTALVAFMGRERNGVFFDSTINDEDAEEN